MRRLLPLLALLCFATAANGQTVVQAVTGSSGFAATISKTITGTVSGNAIFVGVMERTGLASGFSCVDGSNTYNIVIPIIGNGASGDPNFTTSGLIATNVAGGSFTVVCTGTGSGGGSYAIVLVEINGLATSAIDVTGTGKGDNGAFGTSLTSGSTSSTTNANDMIVGIGAESSTTSAFTAGAGYTIPSGGSVTDAPNSVGLAFESKLVSSTGTQSASMTIGTTTRWNMGVGTLIKAATGPSGTGLGGNAGIGGKAGTGK